MSQAPTPMETMHGGHAPPRVRQFSVFLANKVGKLLELVEAFGASDSCQICALTVHEASDHAVVRVLPSSSSAARALLQDKELPFSETDLLVVELGRHHTLATMCLYLLGAELNIHFAYPVMLRPNGLPTIALSVDDLQLAGQILLKKGFRLLGEADLPRPDDR